MPTVDHCLPTRQDYIDAECEEQYVPHRKAGCFFFDDDSSSSYLWAVFPRSEVERVHGEITPDNADDIASNLTGWARSYSGPGRGFSSDPTLRLFKHAVLVKQHRGLDI